MHARAAVVGLVLALAFTTVVSANTPTPGASKGGFSRDQVVYYKYAGSYPTWLSGAMNDSALNYYHDSNHNNHAPTLAYSSSGAALFHYFVQTTSPCTDNSAWIQCTQHGGTTSWDIYVRNFHGAPLNGSKWWEDVPHCSAGTSCFYLHRAGIHELGHAMLTFADLSGWEELDTVMNGTDPHVGLPGATHWDFQRCDEAASQLLWDVKSSGGEYGDCFGSITNHGVHGLITELSMGTTTYTACNMQPTTVSGRIQVKDYSTYGPLGGKPLTSRAVHVDRGSTTNYTSATATNASGDNWSVTIPGTSNLTYSYVAHFDYLDGSGLDASNTVAFTIRWNAAACL